MFLQLRVNTEYFTMQFFTGVCADLSPLIVPPQRFACLTKFTLRVSQLNEEGYATSSHLLYGQKM